MPVDSIKVEKLNESTDIQKIEEEIEKMGNRSDLSELEKGILEKIKELFGYLEENPKKKEEEKKELKKQDAIRKKQKEAIVMLEKHRNYILSIRPKIIRIAQEKKEQFEKEQKKKIKKPEGKLTPYTRIYDKQILQNGKMTPLQKQSTSRIQPRILKGQPVLYDQLEWYKKILRVLDTQILRQNQSLDHVPTHTSNEEMRKQRESINSVINFITSILNTITGQNQQAKTTASVRR